MKKNILFAAVLLLITVLVSCKSTNDPISPDDPKNDTTINQNNDSESYYPAKTTYWWDYKTSLPGYQVKLRQSISPQVTKNGKSYYGLNSTASSVRTYFRVDSNIVYDYGYSFFGVVEEKEFKAYDFNLKAGDSLVTVGKDAYGKDSKFVTKSLKRSSTYVINGTVYPNVISFYNCLYKKSSTGNWVYESGQTTYYAKGIGLISAEYDTGDYFLLVDYSFKK